MRFFQVLIKKYTKQNEMSEDFNGLLNALRRGNDVQTSGAQNPWYISPNIAQQPPQPQPQVVYYQAPPSEVKPASSSSWLNIVIVILLLVIITLGIIAWMRANRLSPTENLPPPPLTNTEIRNNQKTETRELPNPASITEMYESWPNDLQQEDINKAVTENILEFVKQSKDIVDVDVDEIEFDDYQRSSGNPKKKFNADESDEVLQYIKKRENLFKDDN